MRIMPRPGHVRWWLARSTDGGLGLTGIQGAQGYRRDPPTTLVTAGHSLRQRHPFREPWKKVVGQNLWEFFSIFPFKTSLFPRLRLTFFHIISTLLLSFPTQYSIIQVNWGETTRRLSKSSMFTHTKYTIHLSLSYTCTHTHIFP